MKTKKKLFILDWQIFPFDVLVALGSNREEILARIKKTGYKLDNEELEKINMHGLGRAVMLRGGQSILWTKNYPKAVDGNLAHEIVHIVHFVTERIGISLSNETDELFGYMTQYLTDKIRKEL